MENSKYNTPFNIIPPTKCNFLLLIKLKTLHKSEMLQKKYQIWQTFLDTAKSQLEMLSNELQ